MSVKRPHGRALANESYDRFQTLSRQSEGLATRDYPACDVSPIHWTDYTRDSECGHAEGVPIEFRCSVWFPRGTMVPLSVSHIRRNVSVTD